MENPTLAIVGATLIDGTGSPPRPLTTIVIHGDRIVRVGPAATTAPPPGARILLAKGKYVIPGLIDAHVHFPELSGELMVTHGVTAIIDWGSRPLEWILAQKEGIAKGKIFGPRLFTSGEWVGESPTNHPGSDGYVDPEEARAKVRYLKSRGVDKIDVGYGLNREALLAVIDEARKAGLRTSGYPVYTRAAIEAGIAAIKHTYVIATANADPKRFAEMERLITVPRAQRDARLFLLGGDYDGLVRLMVEKKVAWVPSLIKDYKVMHDRRDEFEVENYRLLANPELQYLPVAHLLPQLQNQFSEGIAEVDAGKLGTVDRGSADWELYRESYKNLQGFMKKLVEAGGRVLVGTAPHSYVLPGLAVHQELQLFVDAGLTPMQAIQSATLWSAEYIGADKDIGSIVEGKLADVVVLKRNPLENIRNTRSIDAVIQGGRVMPLGYHRDYRNPIPLPKTYIPAGITRSDSDTIERNGIDRQGGPVRTRLTGVVRKHPAGDEIRFA
jgi:hypothetical protein